MVSLATKYPNVYIDTSAYKVRRYPKELVEYMRGQGRRKGLFGSNYPAWLAKDCLEDYETLAFDGETEKLFLYENAERVFKIGSAS
jgi:predicted TIM-barrel fold metal-dependent hydrolase